MADGSEYSTNYLMRDVAPKLWKQLSNVFGRSVGKTSFRVALETYTVTNAAIGSELLGLGDRPELLREESGRSPTTAKSTLRQEDSVRGRYWPNQVAGSLPDSGLSSRREGRSPDNPPDSLTTTVRARLQTPMYGYERELARVQRWLMAAEAEDRIVCVMGIWGLRGVGKTMLADRLIAEIGDSFDQVVRRSLQGKPLPGELCASVLAELRVSSQPAQAVSYLLAVMARKSVLLLLEDVESVLAPKQLVGNYLTGYEGYEDFFSAAMGTRGCIVVTGIEGPAGLVQQSGSSDDSSCDTDERQSGRQMRSLALHGLDPSAAIELLQKESLSVLPDSVAAWPELAQRYQGHPMALKAAARMIREFFGGRVDEFLTQTSVLFTDVQRLLSPSFNRLCVAELNILYWLASQDCPLSLAELKMTLPISLRSSELISALDSLKQRSLLIVQPHSSMPSDDGQAAASQPPGSSASPTFSLPALVKAYAIDQFVRQLSKCSELSIPAFASRIENSHLLEPVISLGSHSPPPVCLNQWFEGQFDTRWQPLESLFREATCPAMRLRSVYRFRDETFVKRCKSVVLSTPTNAPTKQARKSRNSSARTSAILLIAIHQESGNLYKICVQVQPAIDDSILPESIKLCLLDVRETVVASVAAEQADSFIQLPYFQGVMNEPFEIELTLNAARYREQFVV